MCSLLVLFYAYYFSLSDQVAVLNECMIREDFHLVMQENKCQFQQKKTFVARNTRRYLNDIIKLTGLRNHIIRFKTTTAQRAIWSNFDTSDLRRVLCSFRLNLVHCLSITGHQ